jgi:hypothetical protein
MSGLETVNYRMSDGKEYPIRQRWSGCEPPGPIGSGVLWMPTHFEWRRAEDGVWVRTIFAWEPISEDAGPQDAHA